jgi:uncharacterized protein (DUF58 family)
MGAVLLFIVGTNNQAGWLIVLSSLLLGVAAAGMFLPVLMVRRVTVERVAPEEAFQGSALRVDLAVGNEAGRPKVALTLRDRHIQPVRVFLSHVGPGERAILSTQRTATRRGVMESERVMLSSGAPFGVAEARRAVPAAGRTIVYPRVVPVSSTAFLNGALGQGDERARQLRRGGDREFLGLREYRPGDSMRHVHWPSTARTGSLMVREFEQDQVPRLGILVDTWSDAGVEDTPLDLACSIAASVALPAMALGYAIEVAAAADGMMMRLEEPDRHRVLRWLAELVPGGGLSIAEAAREAAPLFAGCQTVLLAAPTWLPMLDLPEALSALQAQGPRVIVAAVEPSNQRRPLQQALSSPEVEQVATRLASRGVELFRIQAGEDLESCLNRALTLVR